MKALASSDDHRLAAALAGQAGERLLALQREGRLSGRALGDAGDREANDLIVAALRAERPGDAILSEEMADDPARLRAARVWIVDPLDGTREFAEGRTDWAVHVALTFDGEPVAGAVAVPARQWLVATGCAPAARPARRERPLMLVSRSRAPADAERLADLIGADLRPMGSAGAKTAAVIAGEADLYYHAGGQHEWDNAAPAAAAMAAGLHASRADGSPLIYNRADTLVPDLVIGDPELAQALIRGRASLRA